MCRMEHTLKMLIPKVEEQNGLYIRPKSQVSDEKDLLTLHFAAYNCRFS